MKCIYSVFQARIETDNPFAEYTLRTAHSLNLIGTHAVESCPEAVRFFDLVQELYNFFSKSEGQYYILHHISDIRNH